MPIGVIYGDHDYIILYACDLRFGGLIQTEKMWVLARKPLDPEFDKDPYSKMRKNAKAVMED